MITKHQDVHPANHRERIPIIWIIFLLVLLFRPIPLHAQWSAEGVNLDPVGYPYALDFRVLVPHFDLDSRKSIVSVLIR